MKKSMVMWMVGLVLAGSLSARATVVFSDDFSGDLSKWSVAGNTNISGGVLDVNQTAAGDPWHASASSVATWTTGGHYELTFDTNANGYPLGQTYAVMPGGLKVKFADWSNPGMIVFKGSDLASAGVGFNGGWRTIKMVIDSDTNTAALYVDNSPSWSGTLPSAPDFNAYNSILFFGQFTGYSNSYDNVQLTYVPEPATMIFLGLGGLLLRRRK